MGRNSVLLCGEMANFDAALAVTLKWEGGYVNDPADPGGETKYGISKRSHPNVDIQALTHEQAAGIYRRDYWSRIKGGDIRNQATANVLFDMAVNMGAVTAIRILQHVVGVEADGVVGPITLRATNTDTPPNVVVDLLTLGRLRYYHNIIEGNPSLKRFLWGWMRRTMDVPRAA